MSTLNLERHFAAPPALVFEMLTRPENIAKWWGHEDMTCPVLEVDLTKRGPWVVIMMDANGARYKVSGEVIRVDPPHEVEFTWGWHDEADERGHSSTVHFMVESDGEDGSLFKLTHAGLADEDSAAAHNNGWSWTMRVLDDLLTT